MEREPAVTEQVIAAAHRLAERVEALPFAPPISHVYNPLTYAWTAHALYLRRYARRAKRVVFLGINPGPFGMVQCGVPFGEIAAVRDWLKIDCAIAPPATVNPQRPIEGFACARSEVSGRRLWGLFRERFGNPEAFFAEHFVANYCPLAFFDRARNVTPDKLPAAEALPLFAACDEHLRALVGALQPAWVIGVGGFAEARAAAALATPPAGSKSGPTLADMPRIARILHPSPASPAANRGWAEAVTEQLQALGVWS